MPREKLKPLPPIRFSFSACRSRGSANRLEMLLFEISSFNSIARWQSTIEFDYVPAKDFLAISLTKIRDSIKKKSEWKKLIYFFFISWGFIWVRFVRSKSHRAGLRIPRDSATIRLWVFLNENEENKISISLLFLLSTATCARARVGEASCAPPSTRKSINK